MLYVRIVDSNEAWSLNPEIAAYFFDGVPGVILVLEGEQEIKGIYNELSDRRSEAVASGSSITNVAAKYLRRGGSYRCSSAPEGDEASG